jgi:sphingomyelin phosphodiesterase
MTLLQIAPGVLQPPEVMHLAAITLPVQSVVNLMIRIFNTFPTVEENTYAATYYEEYSNIENTGPYLAQLLRR